MMIYQAQRFVLFEIFILLPASSSIQKRREALKQTLKQIEEECVAVVSKRMTSVKIYLDLPSKKVIEALFCCNRLVTSDLRSLRANKRNIILKQRDGSMYLGDPYLHHTTARYLELRANRNLRRLALMKYDAVINDILEIDETLDKVDSISETENRGKRRASCRKRKNHICKICLNKHVGHGKYCCQEKNNAAIITVVHCESHFKPDISGRSADIRNVVDGRGGLANSEPLNSIQHPYFSNFETRLSTFKNWRRLPNKRSLAENGFFYQGVEDTTVCHSCAVTLKHWDPDDDPLLEHIRYSPTCKYLENSLGRKTLQEFLDQIGSDSKQVKNGFENWNALVDWDIPRTSTSELQRANSLDLVKDRHEENTSSKKSARSPSYQSIEVRLSTFGKFPNINEICIRDIAQAGFYYTGMNDVVRCYFCDLGLRNWEYGDDPYKEHARYLPDCDHLRNVKGEDFIRHIQEGTRHPPKKPSPSSNPRELAGVGKREIQRENEDFQKWNSIVQDQSRDKGKACTNLLHTSAAQSVLEHGYKDELVLAAIRKLNITDETKLTAIQILEVIFDAEEKGNDLVEKNINYESQKYQSKNVQSPNEDCQQLLAENQKLKSMMLCKYCQAREKNILLLPCAHRSLCHECANKSNLCPECWKPIKERVRTYMA